MPRGGSPPAFHLMQSDFYEVPTKAYQIEGKQMGMPQGWGTSLYVMNLDVFENNGVKPDEEAESAILEDEPDEAVLKAVAHFAKAPSTTQSSNRR